MNTPDPAARSVAMPGWYPDPQMAGTQRYWDGARWSEHVAPAPAVFVSPPAQGVNSGLEAIGWICAFAFPLAGFIIGIIVASKAPRGGWMIGLSVVCFLGYFAALSN